jgi:hypothetical protein
VPTGQKRGETVEPQVALDGTVIVNGFPVTSRYRPVETSAFANAKAKDDRNSGRMSRGIDSQKQRQGQKVGTMFLYFERAAGANEFVSGKQSRG